MTNYLSEIKDMFTPGAPRAQPPLNSDLRIVLAAHNKECGVVPGPIGRPAIQPDGSVQPSLTASDMAFSANPVSALSPLSIPAAAGSPLAEWEFKPQPVNAPTGWTGPKAARGVKA